MSTYSYKETAKKGIFHLDVLIEKQEDRYTAHCLQFDLATEGNTIEEAEEMIIDAIFEYVTFAAEHNLIHKMFRPAPTDDWQKLSTSKPMKHVAYDHADKLVSEVDLLMAA
ncbi:MAG: type II toxin-antitoxin system HicB family antitoxin [Thermodesulfobacteriota bacterium]|nr:type II toxin-antitoxin system HicB family antitoxin [Thermodesulfobacteriota bacterium]